jgi:hypothetical protein
MKLGTLPVYRKFRERCGSAPRLSHICLYFTEELN